MSIELFTALSPNRGVCFVGDSRTVQGWASSIIKSADGLPYWLEFYSQSGALTSYDWNFGTSGYTSAQVLANMIPLAAACSAGTAVYFAGTNDRSNALPLTDTISNTTASIAALLAVGKKVIVVAETPRISPFALTGDQADYHVSFRLWLRDYYKDDARVAVVDVWPSWTTVDASAVQSVVSTKTKDGLHPGADGARDIGRAIAAAHDRWFSTLDFLPAWNAGYYSANNPRGNLLTNPMTGGSSGAKTAGTGGAGTATGSVANSYSADTSASVGLTMACAKVALNAWEAQQITFGGTPTSATPFGQLRQTLGTPGNVVAGDVLEAFAYVELDAGQTGLAGIALQTATVEGGTTRTARSGDRMSATSFFPTAALAGIIRTPRITIGQNPTSVSIQMNALFVQNVAASAVLRTSRWLCRKVID
jgi:lysophospholipase L1-like esterase